jgi:hypothetical protein
MQLLARAPRARRKIATGHRWPALMLYSLKSICLMNTILPLSFLTML